MGSSLWCLNMSSPFSMRVSQWSVLMLQVGVWFLPGKTVCTLVACNFMHLLSLVSPVHSKSCPDENLIVSCLIESGVIVALEQAAILVSTSGYLGLEFVIFSSEIRHRVITGRSQVPADQLSRGSVMALCCCSPDLSFHNFPCMTWKGEEFSDQNITVLQRVLQSFEISNQDRAISFCWFRKGYQSFYLFQTLGTDFTAINSFLKIKKQKTNYLKLFL